jgi:hypothetical protein
MAPRAGLRCTTSTVPKPSAPAEKNTKRTVPMRSGSGSPNAVCSHAPKTARAATTAAIPPGTNRPRGLGSSR